MTKEEARIMVDALLESAFVAARLANDGSGIEAHAIKYAANRAWAAFDAERERVTVALTEDRS